MAEPITMPQLGESVTEGTITRWLKAEGEEVEQDEPIAEVETDKVNTELPSPLAGKLQRLLVSEGTTVDVGTEIALVATGGEEPIETPPRENAVAESPTEEFPAAGTEAQPVASAARPAAEARTAAGGDGNGRASASAEELRLRRSSPVVRRLAAEHGVEISSISGTGTGGRVTKKDIEVFLEEHEAAPEMAAQPAPTTPEAAPRRATVHDGDRVEDVTGIRRAIANRMALSKREIPHAWTLVEVDVTGLAALREKEKAAFLEREGVKLTYLPFIVKAAVEALGENPVLNSVWDGDRIVLRKKINVGIAVDLDGALIVPVVPDADELNITGLARRVDAAVKRARAGKLGTEDVSGGTFTVNNPGSLGSVASTPIINHPQAAILQAEAIVKRPVVLDDAIAIRSMMNLEVSFDHRILDGGAALKFLNAVKRRLEGYGPEDGVG
ncbi:2-oxo acid dehydrogenase subunit E2 [Rubrobacter tropicus]|uniref:Dihydrolipoamide acetyltransferase component of pyruvate dehydrogenase complex n=1 Tax=Rubrobacter tropicus TaxID=2653851 RepID=A0A6G8Q5V2_9ACTN|nr:dihydrolipoamide acetyltransferase family protein [Rubrobacter tropicus]QIN81842.1 2-oxo acid dehydrogenase subunit E2 [Rubrobacter tropicus]